MFFLFVKLFPSVMFEFFCHVPVGVLEMIVRHLRTPTNWLTPDIPLCVDRDTCPMTTNPSFLVKSSFFSSFNSLLVLFHVICIWVTIRDLGDHRFKSMFN